MSSMTTPELIRQHVMDIQDIAHRKGVCSAISENDLLFNFLAQNVFWMDQRQAINAYFEGGQDDCRRFASLCIEHGISKPRNVLEFASGYGRVARHKRHFVPSAHWLCCDIHPEAVEFNQSVLGLEAMLSASRPEDWRRSDLEFQVVFALSFFSHTPDGTFASWLERLAGVLEPGGLLIFTTHGEVSASNMRAGGMDVRLDSNGYFWHPMNDQPDLDPADYGTSIVTSEFVLGAMREASQLSLVRFQQAYWWGHQDLYVVRKLGS